MIRGIEDFILDTGGKHANMARRLMSGSAIERSHLEFSCEKVRKVCVYLRNPSVGEVQLIYGSNDAVSELNIVMLDALEIACQFRSKSINGSKVFGFCFGYCSKLYNRRQIDCDKGLIARILIYSYYEGSLLEKALF